MSGRDRVREAVTAPTEQPQRDGDAAARVRQLCVGDSVPRVLTLRQLAANLQISERALLAIRKAGTHPGVKQLEGPGDPRFCGLAFKAWSDGAVENPLRRHFFGGRTAHARQSAAAQQTSSMTLSGMTQKGQHS